MTLSDEPRRVDEEIVLPTSSGGGSSKPVA
jgi:hypothetical protein